MKKIRRIIYLILAAVLCALIVTLLFRLGIIGGLSIRLPALQYGQGAVPGDEIPCGKSAEREFILQAEQAGMKLFLRPSDGNFYVETPSGACWYANPPEGADDWARGVFKTEMVSSLIIEYIDLEKSENIKKNSQAASVNKNTFSLHGIENGFRADYTFKDGELTIPVEIVLDNGYLNVHVITGEIKEEKKERYILSSIRLLPNFGCGAASDEGYIFVPDGQGALMYFNNGKGNVQEYKAAVYGENASVTRMFAQAETYYASLPVFGLKSSSGAFLSIITAGQDSATLIAVPNYRDSSYATAGAEYRLRYRDSYILDADSHMGQVITLYQDKEIELSDIQQRFYFLEGEEADYNGMAACFRDYLLTEGGLLEHRDNTTVYVDAYAASVRRESFLGIPVSRICQLSALQDIGSMYSALRGDITGGIRLQIDSWAKDAVRERMDTRLSWAVGNSWRDWDDIQAAAAANGDTVNLALELAHFKKSGNGLIPIRDSAISLAGSPAFQYRFLYGTRMRDEDDRGYLLHPALLKTYAQRMVSELAKHNVQGVALSTVANTQYGSYGSNKAYPEQTRNAVEDALGILAADYELTLAHPNAYALKYADYLTDIPAASSGYDVMDATIPFLQMVYGGIVGYAGEAVNLSSEPEVAVLHAIAAGEALHYKLITGNAEMLIDTDLNNLFSAQSDFWMPRIREAAEQVEAARKQTDYSRLVSFEWLAEDVSVSAFENGIQIYVNFGSSPASLNGINIPAAGWLVGKEGSK